MLVDKILADKAKDTAQDNQDGRQSYDDGERANDALLEEAKTTALLLCCPLVYGYSLAH
jgi:hypothetical protein